MSYHTLEEVLQELEEGVLIPGMVPTALMDFVDESNVEQVLAGLPEEHRAFVLDWARDVAFAPESQIVHIAGLANLSDMRPEDRKNPRRGIFFQALRSWFAKHSQPESPNDKS